MNFFVTSANGFCYYSHLQLVIGDYGLSLDQQRFQMSLWSIMAAPLFVSADLRTMRPDSQEILLNSLVLSINQDQLGKLGLEIQQVSVVGGY